MERLLVFSSAIRSFAVGGVEVGCDDGGLDVVLGGQVGGEGFEAVAAAHGETVVAASG